MSYWIIIIFLLGLLAACIIGAWYTLLKKKNTEEFRFIICSALIVLAVSIYFGIDIPSAIGGGEKLYASKRPEMLPLMSLHMVYADGQRFIDFSGYNPDKYEQDAKYCITYTKFTKTILKIEEAE